MDRDVIVCPECKGRGWVKSRFFPKVRPCLWCLGMAAYHSISQVDRDVDTIGLESYAYRIEQMRSDDGN